jgi:hypothetical protein
MSIGTMFQLGAQREFQASTVKARASAKPAEPDTKAVSQPDPKAVSESAMQKVLAFVPAEIIGIYVAIFGIATPKSANAKWTVYAICVAVLLALMLFNYFLSRKKKETVPNWWRLLLIIGLALVGFTAWAAAMPETPFLACHPRATMAAGIAAPILALLMPKIAELCDVAPK